MSRRTASKQKETKPLFWVFCEGETEKEYVIFLRSRYRIPIRIEIKIVKSNISDAYIKSFKGKGFTHDKDRNFLMYDADVKDVLEKIKKLKNIELLLSNPCIELWFLLHYEGHRAYIDSKGCVRKLEEKLEEKKDSYKKGTINKALKNQFIEKCSEACSRAKQLDPDKNPSSNIYEFIEALEKVKAQ